MNTDRAPDDAESFRLALREEAARAGCRTDRLFVILMLAQWGAALACAMAYAPAGPAGEPVLWTALLGGGAIAAAPIALGLRRSKRFATRMSVGVAQPLFCGLLARLTDGAIGFEAYAVASLGLLALYRDRRVLAAAVPLLALVALTPGSPAAGTCLWVAVGGVLAAFAASEGAGELRRVAQWRVTLASTRSRGGETQHASGRDVAAERRLLHTIIDSIPHALFWKDRDSVYLGCNQVFADAAGLVTPREIVGLTDFDLPWTTEQAEWYRHCDRDVMLARRPILNVEESQRTPSGEEVFLWTSKTPLRNGSGDVIGVVGLFADVSDKRRAHQELARLHRDLADRQALLEAVFDTAADAIIVADSNGVVVRSNRSADRMLAPAGCSLAGLRIESFMPADTAARHADWIAQAASQSRSGVLFTSHRIEPLRPDGQPFAAELSVSKVTIHDRVLFTGILRDVSVRELLESQLAQARKLESIGRLAAGIAHEINTPMQFVRDNVEFLIASSQRLFGVVKEYDQLLDSPEPVEWSHRRERITTLKDRTRYDHVASQFQAAINDTREGIQRVVSIVRAMKDFSHPGGRPPTPLDVRRALESAVAVARNRWKHAARLEVQTEEGLPLLNAYSAEFHQALLNLVVNAADAVVERYGEDPSAGRITLRARREGAWLAIEVEDNGVGINPAVADRLFDPFFTTKEVGQGTGQGLALVHGIVVNLHGGRVEVRSRPGEGATFVLHMPLESEPVYAGASCDLPPAAPSVPAVLVPA